MPVFRFFFLFVCSWAASFSALGQWTEHILPSDGTWLYTDGGSVAYAHQGGMQTDYEGGSSTDGISWELCPLLKGNISEISGVLGAHDDTLIVYKKLGIESILTRTSFDRGQTWTDRLATDTVKLIYNSSFVNGCLYVYTSDGRHLYSDNYGAAWFPATGLPHVVVPGWFYYSETTKQGTTLWCSLINNLYKSIDGGKNWIQILLPLPNAGLESTKVYASDTVLFLVRDYGPNRPSEWLTSSNGNIWTHRPTFPPQRSDAFFTTSSGAFFFKERGAQSFRSIDNGATWVALSNSIFQINRNTIYNSEQLISKDDGITFGAGGFGLTNRLSYGVFGASDHFFLISSSSHFKKNDFATGLDWHPSPRFINAAYGVLSDKQTVAEVNYYSGRVAYSIDGGESFQYGDSLVPINTELKAVMENVLYLTNATSQKAWLSTDFGANLQPINPLPGNNYYWMGAIESGVYLLVNNTKLYKANRNNPTVFHDLGVNLPVLNHSSLVTIGEQLFFYSDGKIWRFDGTQLEECPTLQPVFSTFNTTAGHGNELFLMNYYGSTIYRSIDAGKTWFEMQALPQIPTENAVYIMSKTNAHLWVYWKEFGSRKSRLYSWPFQSVAIQEPQKEPFSFTLSPNPARDQCIVRIDAPNEQSAKIQVFDISGNVVLIEQFDQIPEQFALSLKSRSRGLYFVQVQTEIGVVVRKLVVE